MLHEATLYSIVNAFPDFRLGDIKNSYNFDGMETFCGMHEWRDAA